MNKYVCEAEISRHDFDRINKLMEVMFEDYETNPEMKKLIDELDARPDTTPYSFYFDFNDGSKIYINIRSGTSNYYDDCYWVSADNTEEEIFDCAYEIVEENEFVHNNTIYVCKFIIKED